MPVEVSVGYDPVLDYVHCTVRGNADVLYSNLGDEEAGTTCKDVEYYRAILEQMGVSIPEAIFRETKKEQAARTGGNIVVDHTPR